MQEQFKLEELNASVVAAQAHATEVQSAHAAELSAVMQQVSQLEADLTATRESLAHATELHDSQCTILIADYEEKQLKVRKQSTVFSTAAH